MKIHILFEFHEGPWGGGNQFLSALRQYFRRKSCYAETTRDADAILFNSHHNPLQVLALRRRHPEKAFVHRVDGPMQVVRGFGTDLDRYIFDLNEVAADGTVYQSEWSRQQCHDLGLGGSENWAVIHNAPDPEIFFPAKDRQQATDGRVRLVAMSWSSNAFKGFDVLSYLDQSLDFSRYTFSFIGKSPVSFENIHCLPASPSHVVAETLRQHDIFVFPSRLECCSNAIGEALNCGLVVIAQNSTSNPELITDGRLLFDGADDAIETVMRVADNLEAYRDAVSLESMEEAGAQYTGLIGHAMEKVYAHDRQRRVSLWSCLRLWSWWQLRRPGKRPKS